MNDDCFSMFVSVGLDLKQMFQPTYFGGARSHAMTSVCTEDYTIEWRHLVYIYCFVCFTLQVISQQIIIVKYQLHKACKYYYNILIRNKTIDDIWWSSSLYVTCQFNMPLFKVGLSKLKKKGMGLFRDWSPLGPGGGYLLTAQTQSWVTWWDLLSSVHNKSLQGRLCTAYKTTGA